MFEMSAICLCFRRFLWTSTTPRVLLQRAERLAEGHLLVVVEPLAAEHQHGVAIHRPVDLVAKRGAGCLSQVDAVHFGGEQRMERGEPQGHVYPPAVIY